MQSTVGGVDLGNIPVIIGAGACKNPADAPKWLEVFTTVVGSITVSPRDGNLGTKLHYPETFAEIEAGATPYNWYGMPNIGIEKAAKMLYGCARAHPPVVSIAEFSIDGYVAAAEKISVIPNVAGGELNFGCQNTEHGLPLSFDPDALADLLPRLVVLNEKPFWAKFSPYTDKHFDLLPEIAAIVNKNKKTIRAVVTCNTEWAFAGKDKISSSDGFASMSGPPLASIAIEQLERFRTELDPDIDIISVGGIMYGNDIVDRLERGANAVALTTVPFWLPDPKQVTDHLLDPEKNGDRFAAFLEQRIS